MKFLQSKLIAGVLIAVAGVASIVFASASHAAVVTERDCSTNDIIKCGVTSVADLRAKYNASSELQAIYGHFGWTSTMINHGTIVDGVAYRNGTITVGSKTVATNAESVGRNINSGSGCNGSPFTINGKTYYIGTTSCRFGADGETVYVLLDSNGQFIGAINRGCGNPTPAKPVVVPPKPQPVYTCDLLTDKQITRTEYSFTAHSTAKNGATLSGYAFNFGDGATAPSSTGMVSHTYAKPGTYTVKVTANFTVNGVTKTATSNACQVNVTVISQTQACNTTTHQIVTVNEGQQNTPPYTTDTTQCQPIKVCDTTVSPAVIRTIFPNQMQTGYLDVNSPQCQPAPTPTPSLPETGITDTLMSILGLGSLTAATWYYIASRR